MHGFLEICWLELRGGQLGTRYVVVEVCGLLVATCCARRIYGIRRHGNPLGAKRVAGLQSVRRTVLRLKVGKRDRSDGSVLKRGFAQTWKPENQRLIPSLLKAGFAKPNPSRMAYQFSWKALDVQGSRQGRVKSECG